MRAEAPWCSQCFLDLRPATLAPRSGPPPVPLRPAPTAAYGRPALDPLTAPPVVPPAATAPEAQSWPCPSCDTANRYDLDACTGCGRGFLAGAHESEQLLVVPGLGDLAAMSRGRRTAVAFGAVVVVMLLVLVVGVLLG